MDRPRVELVGLFEGLEGLHVVAFGFVGHTESLVQACILGVLANLSTKHPNRFTRAVHVGHGLDQDELVITHATARRGSRILRLDRAGGTVAVVVARPAPLVVPLANMTLWSRMSNPPGTLYANDSTRYNKA